MLRYFHDDYAPARARFLALADELGYAHTALPFEGWTGPDGGEVAIDLAVRHGGGPIKRAVVVSSGTHGVEGYFGSAVQLAAMDRLLRHTTLAPGDAVVMIHGVNAWGFAHKRRVDPDGIDLNRNFLLSDQAYEGAPEGYRRLNDALNPSTPPGGLDPFWLQAAGNLLRHGFSSMKDAIASGQYAFPDGLFYGGQRLSRSGELLATHLPPLLGDAERVIHIDLHTGMGRWGTWANVVDLPADDPRVAELTAEFGPEVQGMSADGVLYAIRGAFGPWLEEQHPGVRYDTMLSEFGTRHVFAVLAAMRFENRIVRHAADDRALRAEAARRMMEAFCPSDAAWRDQAARAGVELVARARAALHDR